jgi:dihydrofolate reductase
VHGSSDLIQHLLGASLVDVFRVNVFPVILGRGKRLLGEGAAPTGLSLVEQSVSSTGVIMATWKLSGPITPGSFALEEPTEAELRRREKLQA